MNAPHTGRLVDGRVLRFLKRVRESLFDRFGIVVDIASQRPAWPGERKRFTYQQRYVEFDVRPGDRVLDVGSGGDPFPHASVLLDRYPDNNATRHEALATMNRPFVLGDIHDLPFRDKSFDYVYCVHVLEAIADPLRACQELMRVGKRGFIETPVAVKDLLFAWARGNQKWHVVSIGRILCFFEYSERQLDGIKSTVWRDLVLSRRRNPIQEVFYRNQDAFNAMFAWTDSFSVFVFKLDGSVQSLRASEAIESVVSRNWQTVTSSPWTAVKSRL
jgi:SAM-dependent methyltransferase